MHNIHLDKTISLTRGIMNREVQIPDFVRVMGFFKPMDRFNFVDSNVEIPIEHIGLAILSYQNAVDQYTFTKIEHDPKTGEKTETQQFEPLLNSGSHISDFLSTIMPDALNWYSDEQGAYEMEFYSSFVPYRSPKDFNQCKVYNQKGEDLRELAITEAYRQAVRGYVANTVSGIEDSGDIKFVASLHDFMEEDAQNFGTALEELRIQSAGLILHTEEDKEQPTEETGIKDGQDESFSSGDEKIINVENIQDQDTIRLPNLPIDTKGGGIIVLGDSSVPPEQ